jgi:hypothetical protein
MAAVSRTWLREVAQPTSRLTRRAAHWTAHTTQRAARGAVRSAHGATRQLAQSFTAARLSGERHLREAEHALRTSWLPEAGARVQRTRASLPKGLTLLFLGSVLTGAVYGLSGSAAQTLTTAVCTLTLWLLFSVREAQQLEALALRRSLEELRASLRVTQALLEASELQGAEELRNSRLPPASATASAEARQQEDDETRRISMTAIVVG